MLEEPSYEYSHSPPTAHKIVNSTTPTSNSETMRRGFLSSSRPSRQLVWIDQAGPLSHVVGEVVGEVGDYCTVQLVAEVDSDRKRRLQKAVCRKLQPPAPPGALLLFHGCTSQWCLERLLGALSWRAPDGTMCSLQHDVINHILSHLTISRVSADSVVAISSSSIDDSSPERCTLQHALDPSEDNWWISAAGSTPGGVGAEFVTFRLSDDLKPRRIERVRLRIPPMPSGPLSVRDFHLESASAAEGPWRRATSTLMTMDRAELQEWAVWPPIEASHVRVVCTRNAARERLDTVRARFAQRAIVQPQLESDEDFEAAISHVPPSIGFFQISFG